MTPKLIDAGPRTIPPAAGRESLVPRRVLIWAVAVPLTLMAVLAATLFGQIQSQ